MGILFWNRDLKWVGRLARAILGHAQAAGNPLIVEGIIYILR
jgi:hypothetical protein